MLILPLMAGLMASSIASGRMITKTGRYKRFPIVGTATIAVGMYLMSTMGVGTSRLTSSLYMVVLGLGMGMIIQVMVLAVQNSVPHSDLGTATATETFMRSMGGAFGVAIFGAIFTNRLAFNLGELLPGGAGSVDTDQLQGSPQAIRSLAPGGPRVGAARARSIDPRGLPGAVPLAIAAFLVTWLLPEKQLRETAHVGAVEIGDELLTEFGQIDPESAPELVVEAGEDRPPPSR